MFNTSKIITAITKKKIRVYAVTLGTAPIIEKRQEFEWTTESLAEVLDTIKKNFGVSIRILFSDEFVYITTVKTDSPHTATRASIQAAAQELIPEDMNKTSWDYRVYPEYIQIAVLNTTMYDQITEAVKKADIDIEAIESYSSALARLSGGEKDPFILIYQDDPSLIITVDNAVSQTVAVIHEPLTGGHIEKAVHFSQEQFTLTIKKIIKTEKVGDIFTGEFFKDFTIETKNLEPAVGLAMKTDIKTPDASSLNLEINSPSVHKKSGRPYTPYVIFFSAFILTVAGFFLGRNYLMKKSANKTALASPGPIIASTAPTASPSAAIQKDYTIEVLNGSGIQGEAGRLRDILAENNYTVTSTGYANDADAGISIHYNAIVDDAYLDDLDKVLKTIYTTVAAEAKLASDEADITIVIGTFIPK